MRLNALDDRSEERWNVVQASVAQSAITRQHYHTQIHTSGVLQVRDLEVNSRTLRTPPSAEQLRSLPSVTT